MRWEYKVVKITKRSFFTGAVNIGALEVQLNELGREGWELVNFTMNQMQGITSAVLKRQR
ncbi:MAG: DUF4177 domain-containing protein [Moraxellaceae bacterium]|nr:MAG: DUF4177 domain-containing protein [Moraxellaceae bacterium]